jgi:hypothetical protein
MDLVFCAGSQDPGAAARFAVRLRQVDSDPHFPLLSSHKDAASMAEVVSG